MASPQGTWNVVTNLNNAFLQLSSIDGQGNVIGSIELNPSETHVISGTWDAVKKELNFSYSLNAPPPLHTTIAFTGFLFEAGDPLFSGTAGGTTAHWNMLAGTFGRVLSTNPSTSGWVARQAS